MPATAFLIFDCETCDERERVPVEDVDALVAGARLFFVRHEACRTVIDLTDTRYEVWRVPSRIGKNAA